MIAQASVLAATPAGAPAPTPKKDTQKKLGPQNTQKPKPQKSQPEEKHNPSHPGHWSDTLAYGLYGGFSTVRRLTNLGHAFDHKNLNYGLATLMLTGLYPTMMFNHGPLVQTGYLFAANLISLGDTSINYNQYAGNIQAEAKAKGFNFEVDKRAAEKVNLLAVPKVLVRRGSQAEQQGVKQLLKYTRMEFNEGAQGLKESAIAVGQLLEDLARKPFEPGRRIRRPEIFNVFCENPMSRESYARNLNRMLNMRRLYAAGALGGMGAVLLQGAGVLGHFGGLYHLATTGITLGMSALRSLSYGGVTTSMWHLKNAQGKPDKVNRALGASFGVGSVMSAIGMVNVQNLWLLGLERLGRACQRPQETYRHFFEMEDRKLIKKDLTDLKTSRKVWAKVWTNAICVGVDVIAAAALMGGPAIQAYEEAHETSLNPFYYLVYKFGQPSDRIRHFYEHPSAANERASVQGAGLE